MKIDIEDTKYGVVTSNKFNKQLKKIVKQGKDIKKLTNVIKLLANGEMLDAKYRDHALSDNKYFRNCRECHLNRIGY